MAEARARPVAGTRKAREARVAALAFRIATTIGGIDGAAVEGGELVIRTDLAGLLPLLTVLKTEPAFAFEQLMDLCGVDWPQRAQRFDVVYNLLSVSRNARARVIVRVEEDAQVPSVHTLWPAATWWERECYDLFGVLFSGQPDLRRILTDYGFEGHPLRKDFPLTGFVEMRYDEEQKRVIYEPVRLAQELRNFDFQSPWEGVMTLPGDEKAHEGRHGVDARRGRLVRADISPKGT